MRLSIGYPVINVPWFKNVVKRFSHHIDEIYFSWRTMPSGRMPISDEIQARMQVDLQAFQEMGLRFCLLLNGNCYGGEAMSTAFSREIKSTINGIFEEYGTALTAITTTSP